MPTETRVYHLKRHRPIKHADRKQTQTPEVKSPSNKLHDHSVFFSLSNSKHIAPAALFCSLSCFNEELPCSCSINWKLDCLRAHTRETRRLWWTVFEYVYLKDKFKVFVPFHPKYTYTPLYLRWILYFLLHFICLTDKITCYFSDYNSKPFLSSENHTTPNWKNKQCETS